MKPADLARVVELLTRAAEFISVGPPETTGHSVATHFILDAISVLKREPVEEPALNCSCSVCGDEHHDFAMAIEAPKKSKRRGR